MSAKPIDDKSQQGFLVGLLGDIPGFVRGILATMFGTTICFVAMLQLGGLQVPFTNFLTAQMIAPVQRLDESVNKLSHVVERIAAVERQQASQGSRQDDLSRDIKGVEGRVLRLERRFGIQQ
jgi:hypothetical protein